jgi:hypothetical protein
MIERPIVIRALHAAATSLHAGSRPWESNARAPADCGDVGPSDAPAGPPRPTVPETILIPLRSGLQRCSTKGCVFPASARATGKCRLHEFEELEPAHFLSRQPTQLLLDRAKFGPPDEVCDSSGARDRRRLAALREQFLEDVA